MTDFEATGAFLAHFGVLGMHWGVRKEQKKAPATHEQTIARRANAQKFVKEASASQARIDAYKALTPKFQFQQRSINNKIEEETKIRDKANKNAAAKKAGHLSSDEKKAIGVGIGVSAYIAARALHTNIQSGQFTRLAALAAKGGKAVEFNRAEDLARAGMSVDDISKLVAAKINPAYGAVGTKLNCRRCTFAYELRRRGYDVKATRTTNGEGQNAAGLVNALSPGSKNFGTSTRQIVFRSVREGLNTERNGASAVTPLTNMSKNFGPGGKNKISDITPKGILDALSKEPNGARGELGVKWQAGGGHSIAWEIVDGKPVIFDTQTGKHFQDVESLAKNGYERITAAGYTRLDNVDLDVNYLLRWLQNA